MLPVFGIVDLADCVGANMPGRDVRHGERRVAAAAMLSCDAPFTDRHAVPVLT